MLWQQSALLPFLGLTWQLYEVNVLQLALPSVSWHLPHPIHVVAYAARACVLNQAWRTV